MKKNRFLIGIFMIFLLTLTTISCSTEEQVTQETTQTVRTVEMENFKTALRAWVKYKAINKQYGKQANATDEANALITDEARALLQSEGVSISTLDSKSAYSDKEIISMALKIYAKKTKVTTK